MCAAQAASSFTCQLLSVTVCYCGTGGLVFYGVGGTLYVNGEKLNIKGVNWIGSENRAGPPLGLDVHHMYWYFKFLRDNGFNAVRFLFNHQMVLHDTPLVPPNENVYGRGHGHTHSAPPTPRAPVQAAC